MLKMANHQENSMMVVFHNYPSHIFKWFAYVLR